MGRVHDVRPFAPPRDSVQWLDPARAEFLPTLACILVYIVRMTEIGTRRARNYKPRRGAVEGGLRRGAL